MQSKELTQAKSIKAKMMKQKETYGYISNRSGSRYVIPALLMQAMELEKGKEYYDWFYTEFPDDIGEPNMFIQWVAMFYFLGEHNMALLIAKRLIHENIHAIPLLLEQPLARMDDFWYGSNFAEPDYFEEIELAEMSYLTTYFKQWLKKEYEKPEIQSIVNEYKQLRKQLKITEPGKQRSQILGREEEIFREPDTLLDNDGEEKTEPIFVYQLKITLQDIEPPIWRRIMIKSDTKLQALHKIIQTSFGWTNSHLHQFFHETVSYTDPSFNSYGMDEDIGINYTFISIKDLLHIERQSLEYEYDFGDSWMHTIVLEKILPIEEGQTLPRCTDGERRSPPDDCGGVSGYENLLGILADKTHEEYEETKTWVGKGFNPEKCNIVSINKNLLKKNYGVRAY